MKKIKGKYGAILLAVLMMISFVAGNAYAATVSKATDFKDVAKDAWYYDYVSCLADRGVVQGYGDTGEYQPMNLATREHAAKMIALAAGLDYSGKKADFPDVDPLGEFSPYIAALVEKGAIQGFPDGSFRPQDTIKRSHAAKMIQLAFGLKLSTKEINIIDLPTHDPELVGAIEVLASNGVVKGYGDSNRFKPDHDVNRAEFAKMLCIAITATAIQEAETLRTPAAISRAQALVDGMSNDQDTNTRSFLQTRLDTLKKPVDPDPGKPDIPGPVEVKGITIDEKALNPDPLPMTRLSLQLHATISPSNATNKKIIWFSSHPNFATVDQNGLVEAVGKGRVTITATTEDGKKSDSIDIDVPIVVSDAEELTAAIKGLQDDDDIILLKPGLYQLTKTLEITKSLSLIGPQADVDPRPSISHERTYEEGEEVQFEAILTGDAKSTVEDEHDPGSKSEAENRGWLASLFMIKADNVTINGLTMQRTHNHIIDASEKDNTGLKIVYNIVRQGRGNEGIKLAGSINALAARNYIYDIRLDGDAIEAVGAKGFQILENEIDGCDSVNGTINISNKAGGELGVVEGNLIKNTSYQFAITCKDGSGNVLIKDNIIENADTGGIFIYKCKSPFGVDETRTTVDIINNRIDKYATNPPSGTDSVDKYLRESASAIAVSFNLKEGYQPEITIQGNITTCGGTNKPVLAFGGGTSVANAIKTDLSLITVTGNTFDKTEDQGIYKFVNKTEHNLDMNNNTWKE